MGSDVKRTEWMWVFILLVIVSLLAMVGGIVLIGQSERVGSFSTYHDRFQLESGIFITIISTLSLIFSVKSLATLWGRI